MKMGSKDTKEMNFWTKEEYLKFADVMMESPMFFVIFEILYWTGIREGELLALTPDSFDWSRNTMRIDKSYQRLGGRDVITDPKTPKSIRTVKLPNFLAETIRDYLSKHPKIGPGDRMFPVSKSQLSRVMKRGSEKAGVKRIRIHDLRHSHVSLLIDMGFSAVAIADRMGHESSDITFRYAHLFPNIQDDMANGLDNERGGFLMPCPNYRRKRTISKAFRVSPEENERIELLSKAAGVTQQEYIMTKAEDKEFTIVPDIRTYKMLRDEMRAVYQELSRLRDCSEMDELLAARVSLLSDLFTGLKGKAACQMDKEDAVIAELNRDL